MNNLKVYPIGKIENENNQVKIILDPTYKSGLTGLSGYSHVQVLWWMDGCDNPNDRGTHVASNVTQSTNGREAHAPDTTASVTASHMGR